MLTLALNMVSFTLTYKDAYNKYRLLKYINKIS